MFADVTKEHCIVWSCRENVERFEGRSETYGGSDAVIDLRFSNFCYSPFCALLAATGEPAQRLLGVDSVARNGALYPVGLLDYLIAAGLFEFGACQRLPRPEEHRRGVGRWQHGLRLDASLEFLV